MRRNAHEVASRLVPLALVTGEVDLPVAADRVAASRPGSDARSGQYLFQVHVRVGVKRSGVEGLEGPRVTPVGVGDGPVEHAEQLPFEVPAPAPGVVGGVVPGGRAAGGGGA